MADFPAGELICFIALQTMSSKRLKILRVAKKLIYLYNMIMFDEVPVVVDQNIWLPGVMEHAVPVTEKPLRVFQRKGASSWTSLTRERGESAR